VEAHLPGVVLEGPKGAAQGFGGFASGVIAARGAVGGEGDGGGQELEGEVAERKGEGARGFGLEVGEHLGLGVAAAGATELAEVIGEEGGELRGVAADDGVEETLFEVLEAGGEVHGWG
jgi:hypothetical protein